jgi:hypothetical protein
MNLGRIEIGDFALEASTSEAALLSAMAGEARSLVNNGAHRSYLLPKTTLNGRTFTPSAYFTDGRLDSVHLTWADPNIKGGSPWEDFSFERERSIANADAAWLTSSMGEPNAARATYLFDWGSIWSGFDERSGFSSVVIRYNHS